MIIRKWRYIRKLKVKSEKLKVNHEINSPKKIGFDFDRCRSNVEFAGSVFGLGTFGGKLEANFIEANVVGIGIVER